MAALETVKKIKESLGRAATMQQIEFTFRAPEAIKVYIAGTFNDWNTKSMPMKKGKDGTWRIMVKLSPGKYEYKYFVDGRGHKIFLVQNWPQTLSAPIIA